VFKKDGILVRRGIQETTNEEAKSY
jgi:hypothetical protein